MPSSPWRAPRAFGTARARAAAAPPGSARRCVGWKPSSACRLLHRTTRSVVPTEAGQRLLDRLGPALNEVHAALDVVNSFRSRPAGTLRLNVPVSAARLTLPAIVPPFLAAYPEIRLEVIADDSFVDVLAAGCDAGIRYDERLEKDMVAVPIGPRVQRFATAASPAYLDRHGRPQHPRDLLKPRLPARPLQQRRNAAMGVRARRRDGAGRTIRSAPRANRCGHRSCRSRRRSPAPASSICSRTGCAHISTAVHWSPSLSRGGSPFSGPFLYYPGRRLLPAPLRAFVDFIKSAPAGKRNAARKSPLAGDRTGT